MLSSAVSLRRQARPQDPAQRRRATVPQPQQLSLLDRELCTPGVWDQVDDARRSLVIDALAQLIAKAIVAAAAEEHNHD
jgi:hypothetical protein